LAGCGSLRQLDLTGCTLLTDAVLGELAESCRFLNSLQLGYCARISATGLQRLADGCQDLATLDVSYCPRVTADCVGALRATCLRLNDVRMVGMDALDPWSASDEEVGF